jgi:hypothetical protein
VREVRSRPVAHREIKIDMRIQPLRTKRTGKLLDVVLSDVVVIVVVLFAGYAEFARAFRLCWPPGCDIMIESEYSGTSAVLIWRILSWTYSSSCYCNLYLFY